MRIGLDGKRALFNQTGLGNYSRTLIGGLASLAPAHDYHIYSPKKPEGVPLFLTEIPAHFPTGLAKLSPSLWRSTGIVSQLKKDRIQVYHGLSHELPIGIENTNIGSVVSMHDLIFMRYPELYPKLDRFFYQKKVTHACRIADEIVAISEQTKSDLVDFMGISPSCIRVIYQSCNSSFYAKKADSDLELIEKSFSLPKDFVLYVGSINERKNLLGILQAMNQLKNKLDFPLVIIGNGKSYFDKCKDYILKNKLIDRVIFISNVSNDELPAFYQLAKLFVYPSIFEGFGIPIIEALHSGTPVISSTGSCFAEAGGPDSVYVPPQDSEALADAISTVLSNADLQAQMRKKGLEYVQRFLPERIIPQWVEAYEACLK